MKKLLVSLALFISFNSIHSQLRVLKDNVYNPTLINEAIPIYNDGAAALDNKKYEIAIQKFRKVISLDPNFTDCYDMIAVCFRRTKQIDSAIVYYNRSLKIFSKNRLALNNLGMTYLEDSNYLKAEETYHRSLELNSNSIETDVSELEMNGEPYYGLCRTYFYQKKYELAIVNGNKAYELWKSKLPIYAADALYVVGLSYINNEDKSKGLIALKKSSSMGSQEAKEFLKKF